MGDESEGEITFTNAGSVLKRYRKSKKVSLEDLSEMLGDVSAANLSRYENDKLPLSDRLVERIAVALGVKPTDFMFDCLKKLQPTLRKSSFGKLLKKLIDAN